MASSLGRSSARFSATTATASPAAAITAETIGDDGQSAAASDSAVTSVTAPASSTDSAVTAEPTKFCVARSSQQCSTETTSQPGWATAPHQRTAEHPEIMTS